MSVSPGQRWPGWQVRTEARTHHPRTGDAILTRVSGVLLEGVIQRVDEVFE